MHCTMGTKMDKTVLIGIVDNHELIQRVNIIEIRTWEEKPGKTLHKKWKQVSKKQFI